MFSFDWSELQDVLESLAASPAQKERVNGFVAGIRKNVVRLTSRETLELIATAAHFVQIEDPEELTDFDQALRRLH